MELVPHVHSKINFGAATEQHINGDGCNDLHSFFTVGNIFNDGLSAWLHSERSLEVVSIKNGWRKAVWEFGRDVPELPIAVTCVTELKHDNGWLLIVGTDNGSSGGFVYIFDVKKSKVTKVISFPYAVTALEVVNTVEGGIRPMNGMLSNVLHYFFGIVAVGTRCGLVYLVDLMLDESNFYFDEVESGSLVFVDGRTAKDIPCARVACFEQKNFLAFILNGECLRNDQFYYELPDNGVEVMVDSDAASATSLLYIRQLSFLAVGFTFGGFQLYNLRNLCLEYTFVPEANCLACMTFAFMEPDNDPRNYCYLWVIHGCSASDYRSNDVTVANLYSIAFMQKNFVAGIGYCYQDLTMCSKRFSWPLILDPSYSSIKSSVAGSSLVSCRTIDLGYIGEHQMKNPSGCSSNHDDGGKSLCFFVWEVYFKDVSMKPRTVFAIFDVNQWYEAQMPSKLRYQSSSLCSYVGFFSVDELCNNLLPSNFLNLCVPNGRISHSRAVSLTEILSYPASLVFDSIFLFDMCVVHVSFVGIQGQVIHDLNRIGSSCLVNPQKMFNVLSLCLFSPIHGEPNITTVSLNSQREMILSVALEQNLVGFLFKCVKDLASGKNVTDAYNLRFFQEWAWKRVCFIKTFVDRQCVALYDYSGLQLDSSLVNLLHARVLQLKLLNLVYSSLLDQFVVTTDQGVRELQSKINVINLLALHLGVVLWFLNVGLLPEIPETEELANGRIVYPKSLLISRYSVRREETQSINSSIGPTDILLIDGLISDIGQPITGLWEKDGCNGLYPPPSFHSLLNLYLLNGVHEATKHRIVQYLFLDLAYILNDGPAAHTVVNLVKYPAIFSLSPSLIKLTQGFWLLDHKDFDEALYVLLHPIIKSTDITVWQHRRIMKAFLYQGHPQKALRYDRVRQPNMETPEDCKFHLTLLIANGLVNEAFCYQRTIRTKTNTEDILHHFFLGCQQTNNFRALLQLPFTTFEEQYLKNFMMTNQDKKCCELLVIHYLRCSRYVEAKQLNDELKSSTALETNPIAIERTNTRNSLVEAVYNNLPPIKRTIFENARSVFAPRKVICQYVKNPEPLSTIVSDSTTEVTTQSTLICSVLEKVNEIWGKPSKEYVPALKLDKQRIELNIQSTPFLCNPNFRPNLIEERQSTVVYPTVFESTITNRHLSNQGSPSKKSRYLDTSPVRYSESAKRSSIKQNTEVLSLLQTPPVRRKIPKFHLSGVAESGTITPSSILKGRTATQSPVISPTFAKHSSTEGDFDDDVMNEPFRQLRFEVGIGCDDSTVSYPDSDCQVESATVESALLLCDSGVISIKDASNNTDFNSSPYLSEAHEEQFSNTFQGVARFSEVERKSDSKFQNKERVEIVDDDPGDVLKVHEEYDCNDDSSDSHSSEMSPLVSTSSSPCLATEPFPFYDEKGNSHLGIGESSTFIDVRSQTPHRQVKDVLKEATAEFRVPSVSGHRFAMSPGTILQKMLEVRTRMMEDKSITELDEEPDVEGHSALKNLVDSTIESFLSEPIASDGPKFVSGTYPCDFPSRRLTHSVTTPTTSTNIQKTSPRTRSQAKKELDSMSDIGSLKKISVDKSPKSTQSVSLRKSPAAVPKVKTVDCKMNDIVDINADKKESSSNKQSPEKKSNKFATSHEIHESDVLESSSSNSPEFLTGLEMKRLTRSSVGMSPSVFISGSHNLRPRRYSTLSSSGKQSKERTDSLSLSSASKSSMKKKGKVPGKSPSTVMLAEEMSPSSSRTDDNDIKLVKTTDVFSFSKPTILAEAESVSDTKSALMQNFIFSPPFTRSRSRKVNDTIEVKEKDIIVSPAPPKHFSWSSNLGTTHRSETPINFISPVVDEEAEASEQVNESGKLHPVRQSSVNLRKNVLASRRSTRYN